MTNRLVLGIALAVGLVGLFAGNGGADLSPIGRYQITGTEARVWRVDTVTGTLTTCFQVKVNGDRGFRCVDLK